MMLKNSDSNPKAQEEPKYSIDILFEPDILRLAFAHLEENLPQVSEERLQHVLAKSGFKAEGGSKNTVTTSKKTVKISWLNSIFDTLKTAFFRVHWQIGWATASALAFVVSLIVFWHSFNLWNKTEIFSPEGKKVIASLLEGEVNQKYLPRKKDLKIILEYPPPAFYGFTSSQPSITASAFGAGWVTTRETLLGKTEINLPQQLSPPSSDSWLETEWKHYFKLGNWVLLLFIASDLSHDKTVFLVQPEEKMNDIFAQLKRIFAQLKAEFEAQIDNEAKEVISQLEKIEPLLEKLPTEQINIHEKLKTHLEKLKTFLLSP